MSSTSLFFQKLKNIFIGGSRDFQDKAIFHKISLIAFFAWVGLGSDGLSSSCYGPQEAFLALRGHTALSIFVGIGTVLTIFIIAASYSQIIELFPTGGGGYLVASKLLSPTVGMVSGCALIIDYVLTITVSVASGADALFSLLPLQYHSLKFGFAVAMILALIVLNMRGVRESILVLLPIFIGFVLTHVFIIFYAVGTHVANVPQLVTTTRADIHSTFSELGLFGMIFLILRAYGMGAGTYTGIEAVSNGMPILRDPKVQTAKRTMTYMAVSLSFVVLGLMFAYLLFGVGPMAGKTLNAVLFEKATAGWSPEAARGFVWFTLFSEAAILFAAAQTGFLGGPRVLGNLATDRWFPSKFSILSDRLVMQNGILIMGGLALLMLFICRGSVHYLVVLYSINVFITFLLSQLGMVRHWWSHRSKVKTWGRKLLVNGIGLALTVFILVSMIVFKFFEGGWLTLVITGGLILVAFLIKGHYYETAKLLRRLNNLVVAAESSETFLPEGGQGQEAGVKFDPKAKTAVLLVNGFNGMGLHTLFGIIKMFGGVFKNFVFVHIGVVDAENFKGVEEVQHLNHFVNKELGRYVAFMNKHGYYAEAISGTGVDVIDEITQLAPSILERFPGAVFFGGQLVFPTDSFVLRLLHNHTVFTLQKRLYYEGIPFVILPIRV